MISELFGLREFFGWVPISYLIFVVPIYVITTLIIWFLFSRAIVRLSIRYVENRKWVAKINYRKILIFTGFFILFAPAVIIYSYQEITFPIICKNTGGYQPYAPVKFTSIQNRFNAFEYLPLYNVEFTEWQMKGQPGDRLDKFEKGRYRLQFYTEGSKQCDLLTSTAPGALGMLKRYTDKYTEKGYKLNATKGKCLGIKKIEKFTAQYKVEIESIKDEPSGFGYSLYGRRYKLVDLDKDIIVSQFNNIRALSSKPITSFWFSGKSTITCPGETYKPTQEVLVSRQGYGARMDTVVDGFFIIE